MTKQQGQRSKFEVGADVRVVRTGEQGVVTKITPSQGTYLYSFTYKQASGRIIQRTEWEGALN